MKIKRRFQKAKKKQHGTKRDWYHEAKKRIYLYIYLCINGMKREEKLNQA